MKKTYLAPEIKTREITHPVLLAGSLQGESPEYSRSKENYFDYEGQTDFYEDGE